VAHEARSGAPTRAWRGQAAERCEGGSQVVAPLVEDGPIRVGAPAGHRHHLRIRAPAVSGSVRCAALGASSCSTAHVEDGLARVAVRVHHCCSRSCIHCALTRCPAPRHLCRHIATRLHACPSRGSTRNAARTHEQSTARTGSMWRFSTSRTLSAARCRLTSSRGEGTVCIVYIVGCPALSQQYPSHSLSPRAPPPSPPP
jgi:hypothetical protein